MPLDWLGEVVTFWINVCVSLLGVMLWWWDICTAERDEPAFSFQVPAACRTQRKAGKDQHMQDFEGNNVGSDGLLLFLEFLVFAWQDKLAFSLLPLCQVFQQCKEEACSLALLFRQVLFLVMTFFSIPAARGSCGHRTQLPCAQHCTNPEKLWGWAKGREKNLWTW